MGSYLGVDWAGTGWVAAVLSDETEPTVAFYPTVLNLWRDHAEAETILIDIPIGLREEGKRRCDVEAKSLLGPDRHRSVFLTPTREAVYAPNIEAAKEVQKPGNFGIQNQAWAIVPRIREVDGFLQHFSGSVAEDQILEAHPELCFAGLDGGQPMDHEKRSSEGAQERRSLLATHDSSLPAIFEEAVETLTKPDYAPMIGKTKRDDILDALVLAYTAKVGANEGFDRLPREREGQQDTQLERDVEIVYVTTG